MTETHEPSQSLPRVLVIDDSRMVRAIIGKHIRGSFDVREEADGEAGWETLLLDPTIQVVISDHSMPKLDGYGLIERIRASKISRIRMVPVIMISGDDDEALRVRAKQLGATDFITKGTGTAELLSRLETLVKLSRISQELEAARGNSLIDHDSGLLSRAFLLRQGEQAMSLAKRQGGQISTFVISFDRIDAIAEQHGGALRERILTQFASMLSSGIRREDTLARWSNCLFAILAADTTLQASKVFAARVRRAVEVAPIHHHDEVMHLTVSIGLANSHGDILDSSAVLLDLAEERMHDAAARGGNCVVGPGDVVVDADHPAPAPVRIVDDALAKIAQGELDAVRQDLPAVTHRLLPLLRLLNAEYSLGINLADVEERLGRRASDKSAQASTSPATTTTATAASIEPQQTSLQPTFAITATHNEGGI
jgi:diguanylate cyclase (GGDEF)-like protein